MLKRNIMRLGLVGTGILLALDLSPCGPTGELMELVLPTVIIPLLT
jgi:hypothetical protein